MAEDQQFHHYTMAEDQALAVAYANALRSAVVATLKVDGRFVATKRMYLDSRVLQRHLQLLHQHLSGASDTRHLQLLHQHFSGASDTDEKDTPNKKDVPVFLFSMDFPLPVFVDKHYQARSLQICPLLDGLPLPVFVDKHYQARSLQDMVIAVQSDEVEWDSHLACNGKPVVWNLRNPTRAVLAATVQHLAGVLPMHLTFDAAHSK
ncbi:hypothetical protein T484DRAFT_1818502, partial [Baffinella frigidus]